MLPLAPLAKSPRDLPVLIKAAGRYRTRGGSTVVVHEIRPLTSYFEAKGVLAHPPRKPGGRPRLEFNIWHVSGRFDVLRESPDDIVGALA